MHCKFWQPQAAQQNHLARESEHHLCLHSDQKGTLQPGLNSADGDQEKGARVLSRIALSEFLSCQD